MIEGQRNKYTADELGVMLEIPRTAALKIYAIFGQNLELSKKWLVSYNKHFRTTPLEALKSNPKRAEMFINRRMGQ